MKRFEFSVTPLDPARVDQGSGVVYGVAIITSDLAARGHELHVDEITLQQIKNCAEAMGRVPVKWNHRTGADAVNGYLENFRIANRKLLGDWHLLKSHDRFHQAMEMATRMPGNVGLSAAFLGEDEVRGGKTYARCTELLSVDLVAQPAANPDGLFEARDPRPRNQHGQFAGAAAMVGDPGANSAAYDPGIIETRRRQTRVSMWKKVLSEIKGRSTPLAADTPQEFSDTRNERGRGVLRAAAIGAGAIIGAKLGVKAAAASKFRAVRTGENVAGRVIAVKRKIAVAGVPVLEVHHTGVALPQGRVVHSAPGVRKSGVREVASSTFQKSSKAGGSAKVYVERGVRGGADPAAVRAACEGLRGKAWTPWSNCEHTARRLTGRRPASPQLRGAVIGGGIGAGAAAVVSRRKDAIDKSAKTFAARGVAKALERLGPVHFFEKSRRREIPEAAKAGISAAVSGAVLGLVPAFRRGAGVRSVVKSVATGAGLGAAVGGGGTLIGEKIIGKPKPEEGAPITRRAAIGGGIVGAGTGLIAGVLAHRSGAGRRLLVGASKTWRPAQWARKSGVAGAAVIGTIAGGAIGAAHGADEGQQVDTLNAMKKNRLMKNQKALAAGESLAASRYRKKINDEDLNRRDANILRAGAVGAVAGAALKSKSLPRGGSRAAVGGLLGAGAVLAIRKVTAPGKDKFGDRTRGGKQAETILPVAAGIGVAGLALKKRLTGKVFNSNPELVELAARFKTRTRKGPVALNISGLSKHLLCGRDAVYSLLKSGKLAPIGEHPALKTFAFFDSHELDEIRNENADRIICEAVISLERLGCTGGRLVELAAKESVAEAKRAADRGVVEHEFGVGSLIVKSLLKTRNAWAPVGREIADAAGAAASSPIGQRVITAASSPAITGAVGAVGGAVRAGTDGDSETGVLGGAAKGAILGGATGVLARGVVGAFADPNKVRQAVAGLRKSRNAF